MKFYPSYTQPLSNGETLHYLKTGSSGPTLVLLHGNLTSSRHFQSLMHALEADYQLLAIDMRGFGLSTYHAPITSLQDFAFDILEFLDLLGINHYYLLGWSTGGGVALEMAAARPQAIKKLFLLSSLGLKGYLQEGSFSLSPLQPLPFFSSIEAELFKWNPMLQRIEYALSQCQEQTVKQILKPLYSHTPISQQDWAIYLEAAYQQRNYSDVFRNLLTFNMTEQYNGLVTGNNRIKQVTCPVAILHGKNDSIIHIDTAYQTKSYLPQASLHLFEAGHSILTDQLDQLITTLLKEMCTAER
ncbi:alpha/beta fold hydrolase [Streptococcus marmotae]|uniref:alpha/beta fold hydrolase n=1 Tax=Streptococcus marmotae TaxID=1825069 RepID=UPI0008364A47|nr:alpha/beta hydrolase [Streptococcus marmotae]